MEPSTEERSIGIVDWIWNFFRSIRLAFVLIVIIALLSLIGALIMQVPSEVRSDPTAYQFWLNHTASFKYGSWAPLMSTLRLFDIFHSPWFLAAGALLMLNILVCTVSRWGRISFLLRGTPVKQTDSFYTNAINHREFGGVAGPPDQSANAAASVLSSKGYRVRTSTISDRTYVAADKNRYFRLGTFISHLSLILFVVGFLVGSYFGFRDTNFVVAEGSSAPVGHNTNLSLALNSFTDEYYDDGTPKVFRSDVTLFDAGQQVRTATVEVNHPLRYKGIRFYQSFYGPAVTLLIKDSSGNVVYQGGLALTESLQSGAYQRSGGSVNLPNSGLEVFVIGSAVNTVDSMIPPGTLAVQLTDVTTNKLVDMALVGRGEALKLGDYEVTYLRQSQFSGFQVSRDPGNALIWLASALFLVGIAAVLYFPHKQVWAMALPGGNGQSQLLIRMNASRGFSAKPEFEKLVEELEENLKIQEK